jgi:hypothetical protein
MSFSLVSSRLSWSFLPFARAITILAKPFSLINSLVGFQLAEFFFGEQQLSIPERVMVVMGSLFKNRNVHLPDKQLVTQKKTIGIRQIGFAFANGFDFRPGQSDACRESIQKLVLKRSPPVLQVDGLGKTLFFLISQKEGKFRETVL